MSLAYFRQDGALVRRALHGERDDFGVLVGRYLDTVRAIAYSQLGNHADSEDIAQEVFAKAYLTLHTLRREESFSAWLTVITRNLCHHVRQRRARESEVVEQLVRDATRSDEHHVEVEDFRSSIRDAVMALEGGDREILLLHYFAQRNTRQIAETLGISREAAKKRLQRAREQLGRQLTDRIDVLLGPKSKDQVFERVMLGIAPLTPDWRGASVGQGSGWASAVQSLGESTMLKVIAGAVLVAAGYYFVSSAPPESRNPALPSQPAIEPATKERLAPGPAQKVVLADANEASGGAAGSQTSNNAESNVVSKSGPTSGSPNAADSTWTSSQLATMAGGNPQHTNASPATIPNVEPGTLWETQIGVGRVGDHAVMGPDGNLYVTFDEENTRMRMVSLTPEGKERWRSEPVEIPQRTLSIPALTPAGLVVVGLRDNTVRAFHQSTGTVAWLAKLGESTEGIISSPVVDSAGNVYIGAAGRNGFYKLNGATGDILWERPLAARELSAEQEIERESLARELKSLTDEIRSAQEVEQQLDELVENANPPNDVDLQAWDEAKARLTELQKANEVVSGQLFALTGAAPIGSAAGACSSPALSLDQRTMYVGYGADEGALPDAEGLYAVDTATGAIRWHYRPDDAAHFQILYASPLIGADGTIYQQEQTTSEILALGDKGDHAELKWKYNPAEPGDSPKLAALDRDTLYVSTNPATMDSQLPVITALNLSGELKWFRPFPGAYQGTTPVVTTNAVLHWTAEQGHGDDGTFLYALDKTDGSIMWRKQVSVYSQTGESEIVAPDGTIYVAVRDRVITTNGPTFQSGVVSVFRAYHESAPLKPQVTDQEKSLNRLFPPPTAN